MDPFVLTLTLAVLIEAISLSMFWRLIWPAWKRPGKAVFYLAVSAALTAWLGVWALVFVVGHPLLGWVLHWRFCKKHGFRWWHVEDPQRYVELQKEAVARLGRTAARDDDTAR